MPLPTPVQVSQMIKVQLAAAGVPGAIAIGPVTQTPFVPMHLLVELMVQAVWPAVLTNILTGQFVGSVGSPSAAAAIPGPVPVITFAQMQAALTVQYPLVVPSATALALQNVWSGPFAAAVPTAVLMGVLMALNSSPLTIAGQPGDPVFLALTAGLLDFFWPPIVPETLVPAVLAAWQAHPDLAGPTDRTLTARAMVSALVKPLNEIVLTASVVNPSPPGVAPVVPGTPYPYSLPLVIA